MLRQVPSTRLVILCMAWVCCHAASLDALDEVALGSDIQQVKARLSELRKRLSSLHIRVRRETSITGRPETLGETSGLPTFVGTEEVLFAFKGNNRYARVVRLDGSPTPWRKAAPEVNRDLNDKVDATAAFDGHTVFRRSRGKGWPYSRFHYESTHVDDADNEFPPDDYLWNVGLAVSDPTGTNKAQIEFQRLGDVANLLKTTPYEIAEGREEVDGTPCVVLERRLPTKPAIGDASQLGTDRIWLDLQHGLAVRKRETAMFGRLRRVVNTEFEPILEGWWLPRRSTTVTVLAAATGSESVPSTLTREMSLRMWVVNRTPTAFFALPAKNTSQLKEPAACHWRLSPPRHYLRRLAPRADAEEGWTHLKNGTRIEMRRDGQLEYVIVETPERLLKYDTRRNHVIISTPQTTSLSIRGTSLVQHRETIDRWSEAQTALFESLRERRGDQEIERVTYHFPGDPTHQGNHPIHLFIPQQLLMRTGAQFRTRTRWWDTESGFSVSRACGCSEPKHGELWIEYPKTLPRELFSFQVPRHAQRTVEE